MFYMGGEQELAKSKCYHDVTNSGRSSLRLIIESADLRGKRILLPSFLCEVIVDVFTEYEVNIDFYDINTNFEFQLPKDLIHYDALYLIKFFGGTGDSFCDSISRFKKCIIIDDVFSPYPHVLERQPLWFSYNSLRKISPVADFSLLYSNYPIADIGKADLASFALLKYEAKDLKNSYLKDKIGDENKYLALFEKAEEILDRSRGIYRPSEKSIIEAINFFSRRDIESSVRKSNYQYIKSLLPELLLDIETEFYSFAPILLSNRDEIRRKLMEENIFLAVHWPKSELIPNRLSDSIISIPLDTRYSHEDFKRLYGFIDSNLLPSGH